jgi:chromosome partitioning protein
MAKIIAVVNQKGGVAKTTTTIHLGAALAEIGKRVLLVDLDPQGHVAESFGLVSDDLHAEMSDVIEGSRRITDIIIPNIRQNLDLAPSNIRLSDMELTLVNVRFRENKLRRALEPVQKLYDYILLDCPPSLGLLTVNALIAAGEVIIPVASEYFSMLGLSRLLKTIENLKVEANPDLHILGVVHTRHKRTNHAKEVLARTRAELQDQLHFFADPVNDSTRFAEATGMGKTIYEVAPEIEGAQAYRDIAKEIVHG